MISKKPSIMLESLPDIKITSFKGFIFKIIYEKKYKSFIQRVEKIDTLARNACISCRGVLRTHQGGNNPCLTYGSTLLLSLTRRKPSKAEPCFCLQKSAGKARPAD
jgi:hypothetical protein